LSRFCKLDPTLRWEKKVDPPKTDPIRQLTANFFNSVQNIGVKVKAALTSGQKVDCADEVKSSATAAMTAFQTLLSERLRFTEILGGKPGNQGKANLTKSKV
jgi:hypothetical protein